jgi:hypothetical protein
MGPGARSVRWQRLALMALVVSLAAAGLARQPAPRDEARPRVAVARTRPPAAVAVPSRAAPAAEPDADEAAGEAQVPAPVELLAPDWVVVLPRPEAWPPLLQLTHVAATDSARPVAAQALPAVDAVMTSGDGIEGFEPGMLYWFGPRGLERLQVSAMEAQPSMEAQR